MLTTERSYQLESGPKALTWDRYSELVQRVWRDLLDAADDHDEAIFQKFLETHPCMVPGGQSMSGPSGHSAFPAALIAHQLCRASPNTSPTSFGSRLIACISTQWWLRSRPRRRKFSPEAASRPHSSRKHRHKLPIGKAGSASRPIRHCSVITI